jgi:hypothetical protein
MVAVWLLAFPAVLQGRRGRCSILSFLLSPSIVWCPCFNFAFHYAVPLFYLSFFCLSSLFFFCLSLCGTPDLSFLLSPSIVWCPCFNFAFHYAVPLFYQWLFELDGRIYSHVLTGRVKKGSNTKGLIFLQNSLNR